MVDFLVVIVVFLLTTFRAPDECGCLRRVQVPSAANTVDLVDAPLVTVAFGEVLVDGSPAGDVRDIEASHRIERVDALFNILKAKRELWMQSHPGRAFSGVVILKIDASVSAAAVKSVFQTSASAGYPSESFVVNALPS